MTRTSREIDQVIAGIRQTQDTILINASTWLRSPSQSVGERLLTAKLEHDHAIDQLMVAKAEVPR